VDYVNPNILYILTGDGDGCFGVSSGYGLQKSSIGVLKSYDGGATWAQTGLVFNETSGVWPYDLRIHPTMPEILFAATNKGLYRSLNGGDDWFEILNEFIYELEFKVDDPSTILAVGRDAVYRSTTLGFVWNDTVAIPLLNEDEGRMTLALCPQNANTMYLAASPGSDTLYRGLYISTDAGESFNVVSDTPNIMDDQSWYDLTIVCDPNDITQVMAGIVKLWKSSASGANVSSIGGTHADIHQLITNPLNDRLYAGTDGGV
jgi:hypothetical protein